jgi:hypothetical protein
MLALETLIHSSVTQVATKQPRMSVPANQLPPDTTPTA